MSGLEVLWRALVAREMVLQTLGYPSASWLLFPVLIRPAGLFATAVAKCIARLTRSLRDGSGGVTESEAFGITLPASRVRLMRSVVDTIQTIQLIRGDFDRQQTQDVDLFYYGLRKI
jgi:hypothetical protein